MKKLINWIKNLFNCVKNFFKKIFRCNKEITYTFEVSPKEVTLENNTEVQLIVKSVRHEKGKKDEKIDFTIDDLNTLPKWFSAKIIRNAGDYDIVNIKNNSGIN